MSSKSKHHKPSKALPTTLDADRISDLPDCLIVKIISLLPTKDAVATGALSRRWKKMWTSVTSLDFADKLKESEQSAIRFENFVSSVLSLHDKLCLKRFSLTGSRIYDRFVVNAWLASVLRSGVEEVNVNLSFRGVKQSVLLPSDLFLCKSLVVLKLGLIKRVKLPTSICLPVLKTLHLDEVELSDHDGSIVSLLSGCPLLEELNLIGRIRKEVGIVNIVALAFTSLTIQLWPFDVDDLYSGHKYHVIIDTPALKYLNFLDGAARGYVIKNLNHLVKAEILIWNPDKDLRTKAIADFLCAISHVQCLVFSRTTAECFVKLISSSELVLPNLTCLQLINTHDNCSDLLNLLKNFPRLESLHMQEMWLTFDGPPPTAAEQPSCFRTHLKTIRIENFSGSDIEMKLVKYILRHAKVLETLAIVYEYSGKNTKAEAKFLNRLQMFPRSSSICKVEVLPSEKR